LKFFLLISKKENKKKKKKKKNAQYLGKCLLSTQHRTCRSVNTLHTPHAGSSMANPWVYLGFFKETGRGGEEERKGEEGVPIPFTLPVLAVA
jgi:hypothetical protein